MMMPSAPMPSDPDLLRSLLEPLLDDFKYWFAKAEPMLASERLEFLSEVAQTSLLERVRQAQREVTTTYSLLNVTEGQVGVDTSVLMNWHRLVHECWAVSMRRRSQAVDQ